MWRELRECKRKWGINWVVGGDFNMVIRREERNGVSFSVSGAQEFREVIEGLELADLPLVGDPWKWTNQRSSPSCSRIYFSFHLVSTCSL